MKNEYKIIHIIDEKVENEIDLTAYQYSIIVKFAVLLKIEHSLGGNE